MWVGITRGTTVNRPSAVRKFGENVQLTKPFVDSSYMLDILILYVNSPHTTVQDGINPPFVAMRVVKKAMIVERIYQGTDKILFCHHVIFNDCCQTGISFWRLGTMHLSCNLLEIIVLKTGTKAYVTLIYHYAERNLLVKLTNT